MLPWRKLLLQAGARKLRDFHMKQPSSPQGLEPLSAVDMVVLPTRPRTIRTGLRLNIRGRSVHLRGLRRAPTGLLRWVLILGPGLIATAAGNDAGGIATYSAAGAKYGYSLLWVMLIITVSLAVVQEMCARLGAATGRGLIDLSATLWPRLVALCCGIS